ncbi:MAG: hypothetical protein ACYTAF_15230 [Planctomycetota bacterium]|jgi:RNA polymerase sigma-70 factor (ECF subfamily)
MRNRFGETSLGGARRGFPDTTWGLISRLQSPGDAKRRAALESLCRRYWKPVYWYIRSSWAKKNEDAKDLTQAFFASLLEGELLKRFDPGRGAFRRYLKVLLKGFVGHHEEALRRLKRGGGVTILALDDEESFRGDLPADQEKTDPERAFDQSWVAEVFHLAFKRVRGVCRAKGREQDAALYEQYDLVAEAERPTYAELGKRHGIKDRDVEHGLAFVREELRAQVRSELGDTVSTKGELEEEWNALFG